MKKIVIISNVLGGLYSFRREMIETLAKENEVTIVAPESDLVSFFEGIGCKLRLIEMDRHSTNPINEFGVMKTYMKILSEIKPNVVLTYTIKPNIYAGIVCRLKKIPFVPNITGLGDSIENSGIMQKINLFLYKTALRKASMVFFQNKTNEDYFVKNNMVGDNHKLLPGSGVNLENYKFCEYPEENSPLSLLFVGRIVKDKGIDEFLYAAKQIREKYGDVKFEICGWFEDDYKEIIEKAVADETVIFHGKQRDLTGYYNRAWAVVAPTYHEGLCNVCLEGAASGRPLIATNIPGCMETFDDGVTGIGFEAKNKEAFVEAIEKFLNLSYEEKKAMGKAGREKIEREFDRNIVMNLYFEEIEKH